MTGTATEVEDQAVRLPQRVRGHRVVLHAASACTRGVIEVRDEPFRFGGGVCGREEGHGSLGAGTQAVDSRRSRLPGG